MSNGLSVHHLLEQVLGSSHRLRNGELAFYCKFCNHHKRKFQVNLNNQHWHCWVCNVGGRAIRPLLYKLNVSKQLIQQVSDSLKDHKPVYTKQTDDTIRLPEEFDLLYSTNPDSMLRKHAMQFCKSRNITVQDIARFSIGYCTKGAYANRLVIPSYNENGFLNYFVARDFFKNSKMKYKNPPVSKDVIVFENLVTFKKPIVLVEGVMDAIAVRRNAVPMLGKFPSKTLMNKLVKYKPQTYIALDSDASRDALDLCNMLLDYGINVTNITFNNDEDPSSVGYEQFWKMADKPHTKFSDILRGKLYGY